VVASGLALGSADVFSFGLSTAALAVRCCVSSFSKRSFNCLISNRSSSFSSILDEDGCCAIALVESRINNTHMTHEAITNQGGGAIARATAHTHLMFCLFTSSKLPTVSCPLGMVDKEHDMRLLCLHIVSKRTMSLAHLSRALESLDGWAMVFVLRLSHNSCDLIAMSSFHSPRPKTDRSPTNPCSSCQFAITNIVPSKFADAGRGIGLRF